MKTTVELDDRLLIRAKKYAAERRTTLRRLIEQGLRVEISRAGRNRSTPKVRKIKWVTAPGGLPAGLSVEDRAAMHEWIRKER